MNLLLDFDTPPPIPVPLGATFEPELDRERLGRQYRVVFDLMRDGKWRTLDEIHDATGEPTHSISARLRDFRKVGHTVERRRRGDGRRGLWEYQLTEAQR